MLASVLVVGVLGYLALGLSLLDAAFITVIKTTTIGYGEVLSPDGLTAPYKAFTIVLALVGASTALYTFSLIVQLIVEGRRMDFLGRRRMDRKIAKLSGHVVVCGWGRVGWAAGHDVVARGREVVVIDENPERVQAIDYPTVKAWLDTKSPGWDLC